VLDAFRFHDGTKCDLFAVVVMPEHVHAIIIPLRSEKGDPFSTTQILHSLKSFTANRIHELCPPQRRVWQDESLEHVIRHEESLDEKIEYIRHESGATWTREGSS
jgi:REP element-mobilizing transposase RayT